MALRKGALSLGLSGALVIGGCAPGRYPAAAGSHSVSSFVVWTPAAIDEGRSLRASPLDVIPVRGGDILRLDVKTASALQIGERYTSGQGAAELWSNVEVVNGVAALRATAYATEILAPRGTVTRAYVGRGSDPGYFWFTLEDRVLDWASGPMPAPFPEMAPAERIDRAAFGALDAELTDAVALAGDRGAATSAARAIRRVVGLRSVRALRPPSGYPYFFDSEPRVLGREPLRTPEGHPAYALAPGQPLDLVVSGPALLHVFAQVDLVDARRNVELRVFEGDRVRGVTGSTLPRMTLTSHDPLLLPRVQARSLRRAVVHVPPGRHAYRIEGVERALVVPLLSVPVVHIEDAHTKNEDAQLSIARGACRAPAVAPLCAFALALLGDDRQGAPATPGSLSWSAAWDASPQRARDMAETLSRGGPRDLLIDLEVDAARGDASALATLDRLMKSSIDEATRAAWGRSIPRGTSWRVASYESGHPSWVSLASGEAGDERPCAGDGSDTWPEVTQTEGEFVAAPWHGAQTIELVVAAPCDDPIPVELVVDGERLVANPSAGLVRWHIRTRGQTAHVRRIDAGRARVYAIPLQLASCAPRWQTIRPPHIAATTPRLSYGSAATAPGVEVWLRSGTDVADLSFSSRLPTGEGTTLRLVAKGSGTAGFAAYDESGVRWVRVARVALPAWAAGGVDVAGGQAVAVRAIVRGPRATGGPEAGEVGTAPNPAPPPIDETAASRLSQDLLSTAPSGRGPLYLQRALLLARGGAARGALEDAQAAQDLGIRGANGESAIDVVRRAIGPRAEESAPLPAGLGAYGTEPDFDPDARRCRVGGGERAKFQRALDDLDVSARKQNGERKYDAALSARAIEAARSTPLDPRAHALTARALSGSRWKLRTDIRGRGRDTVGDMLRTAEGPIDPLGELRPSVLAGDPFERATFATVLPNRPAKAVVAPSARGGPQWVDVACVARSPSKAIDARCAVEVQVGETQPVVAEVGANGRARVPLAIRVGERVPVAIRVAPGAARWAALARIVFEREAPGATYVPDVGWVLTPRRHERRLVLREGEAVRVETSAPGMLRVDASTLEERSAEQGAPAQTEVVAEVGGDTVPVPTNGSAVVVAMPQGGPLVLKALRGAVSLAVAERVANEEAATAEDDAVSALAGEDRAVQEPVAPPHHEAAPPSGEESWAKRAIDSPRPLTPFERSLGTTVAASGVVYRTLRTGVSTQTPPDAFEFALAGYRRRIESIGLWTDVEVFGRARSGKPTFGGDVILYEDLSSVHLRLSGSLGLETQQIGPDFVRTVRAHAFAEYSARVTRDFFVLPRLGYDGVYTSLRNRPASLSFVDDEVFNVYRYERPSFVFAQALFWYAPYFDDIFYVRARGSYDAFGSRFSHAALRPGAFVVFGDLDLTGYLDLLGYAAADSFSRKARLTETTGIVARYDLWSFMGSLCVQPGIAAFAHLNDPGWQVNAFVNVFASERRGLRDFSSLELDFPEQRGGGIPWRGATPGGYQ